MEAICGPILGWRLYQTGRQRKAYSFSGTICFLAEGMGLERAAGLRLTTLQLLLFWGGLFISGARQAKVPIKGASGSSSKAALGRKWAKSGRGGGDEAKIEQKALEGVGRGRGQRRLAVESSELRENRRK